MLKTTFSHLIIELPGNLTDLLLLILSAYVIDIEKRSLYFRINLGYISLSYSDQNTAPRFTEAT